MSWLFRALLARLLSVAAELTLTFRRILTAEGETPTADVLARRNEILEDVHPGWGLA